MVKSFKKIALYASLIGFFGVQLHLASLSLDVKHHANHECSTCLLTQNIDGHTPVSYAPVFLPTDQVHIFSILKTASKIKSLNHSRAPPAPVLA